MLNFPDSPTLNQVYQSWAWDGSKWGPASVVSSVNVVNPVSGTVVVLNDLRPVYVKNTIVLALLTIRLPEASAENFIEISFLSPVTVLHIQDSLGVIVPTAPTNAYGPGSALVFCYVDDSVKWTYWK
jgi:hypothetical protein